MTRADKKKTILLYPPADSKNQDPVRHTLLNARDLISHAGWSTSPQGNTDKGVKEELEDAEKQDSDEELGRKELLNTPINQMTRDQLQAYATEVFGTQLDKRLSKDKAIARLQELADASGIKLDLDGPSSLDVDGTAKDADGNIVQDNESDDEDDDDAK